MKPKHFYLGCALVPSLFLAAVVRGQTPALDIKLGLWEVTSASDIGQLVGGVNSGTLTPEQQARMQAVLGALGTASAPPKKFCLTKQKLEKEPFTILWSKEGNSDCKEVVTANTATSLDGTVTCKRGEAPNQVHLESVSQTSVKGTITGTNQMRGRSMTVTMSATGQWVDTDCGKLK